MISTELLRRYPYFADVREESLRQVAMIADEQTIPAGSVFFREGDKADFLHIVTAGEVDIDYTLGSGERKIVDTVVAGELVMWSALVPPYRSTATGTARQTVKLISINAELLRKLCEQDRGLGYCLLSCVTKLLATRLEGARVQLATAD